jgi:pantetheine-phosphate adenylyltransferase
MERIAVFPGSFDPVTRGHESIIRRSLPLFDRIIIAIGENNLKKPLFPLEQRLEWLYKIFGAESRISIVQYSGLTVTFCRQHHIRYILRGLRTSADFEFEREIGQMNRYMAPDIETVFLLAEPQYVSMSSSIVREIFRNGGDVTQFVPQEVLIKNDLLR